jgi:hypothetical protein
MHTVNPYFLNDLMSPITGLGEDDEAVSFYGEMGIISEDQYRKIINEKFVDYYKSLDKDKQQKLKIALSYYLSKPDSDFERVFESCLPPFDPPANARDFFVWIWEELFKQESYMISDLKSYKVVPDIHEPNRPVK